jgi:hypothetical protein
LDEEKYLPVIPSRRESVINSLSGSHFLPPAKIPQTADQIDFWLKPEILSEKMGNQASK